jgi:hypothetical protein
VLDVVHRSGQFAASLGRTGSSLRFSPAPNTPASCDRLPSHPANQNKQCAADHGRDIWISLVIRGDQLVPVGGATGLPAGAEILALTDPERGPDLTPIFTPKPDTGHADPAPA